MALHSELYFLRRKVDYAGNSQSTQAANWVTTNFNQSSACSERPTRYEHSYNSTQLNSTAS